MEKEREVATIIVGGTVGAVQFTDLAKGTYKLIKVTEVTVSPYHPAGTVVRNRVIGSLYTVGDSGYIAHATGRYFNFGDAGNTFQRNHFDKVELS